MTTRNPGGVAIAFVTLGCAKNEVDSAKMRMQVLRGGFSIVEDPASADAVVVNTCSFIQAATEESLETIFDLVDLPSVNEGSTKLIVAGCMPARYGKELEDELPEVDALVPCSKEDDIVEILCRILEVEALSERDLTGDHPFGGDAFMTGAFSNGPSAYVKISDGCDRFCSYCTIPYIRGRYHSFDRKRIQEDVESLIATGVHEIVLIAQDTGRWGTDFDNPSSLSELLAFLAQRYESTWFRVMYIQPEGITDSLLEVVQAYPNICSYFDIPLQHIDAGLLKSMNRTGSEPEIRNLLAHIRKIVPDVTLRTTLIAGYPGETEEAFESLCEFIEENEFDYVGVFPYSQEEGTKAARLPDQIEEEERLDRAQRLRDIADNIGFSRVAQRVGKEYDVLVLGVEEDGQLFGRAQCQAPEVDGVIYLEEGEVGTVRRVTITDTLLYEMEGN